MTEEIKVALKGSAQDTPELDPEYFNDIKEVDPKAGRQLSWNPAEKAIEMGIKATMKILNRQRSNSDTSPTEKKSKD